MFKAFGSCHCNNIQYVIELTKKINTYNPRTCDCEFCIKHCASYISDPNGKLKIIVVNDNNLNRYKVGSGIADFLICKECGVFVSACYEEEGSIYASINSKTINNNLELATPIVVSPKQLNDDNKIKRWQDIWFSNVSLIIEENKPL